jgi:hypothetical protein
MDNWSFVDVVGLRRIVDIVRGDCVLGPPSPSPAVCWRVQVSLRTLEDWVLDYLGSVLVACSSVLAVDVGLAG